MRNDLGSVSADLESKLATLTEKEEELQILRSCLSQVTKQAAATTIAADDVVDGVDSPSDGEQAGEAVGEKKQEQLDKIRAMLNTTKVKTEIEAWKTFYIMCVLVSKFSIVSHLSYCLCFSCSGSAGASWDHRGA